MRLLSAQVEEEARRAGWVLRTASHFSRVNLAAPIPHRSLETAVDVTMTGAASF